MVNFNDDTWKYVEEKVKESLARYTSVCTSTDKTYKELLQAQGAIAALKTILSLPGQIVSANRGKNV